MDILHTLHLRKKKTSHYEQLLKKWSKRHQKIQEDFWYKHGGFLQGLSNATKHFTVGSLAGLALLFSPSSPIHIAPSVVAKEKPIQLDTTSSLIIDLVQFLPREVRPLSPNEEQHIAQLLTDRFGFSVSPEINGIRLNRSYGYIGQEQHLARYPGDSVEAQLTTPEDMQNYYQYGMAPGLGAYGYFAKSPQMTQIGSDREKYYIAVQTFLAPGYNENVRKYNDFFMFRKMLVVNPDNGKAIIADIGDSGPSEWTGKSLGGSPEVMHYLERVDGAQRGPVLYFFIDDPNNTIPLGPIAYK